MEYVLVCLLVIKLHIAVSPAHCYHARMVYNRQHPGLTALCARTQHLVSTDSRQEEHLPYPET